MHRIVKRNAAANPQQRGFSMKGAMAFLIGATAALLVSAAPAWASRSNDAELAKQIREDQSLRQVALDLLEGGLNAGT